MSDIALREEQKVHHADNPGSLIGWTGPSVHPAPDDVEFTEELAAKKQRPQLEAAGVVGSI